MSTKPVKNEAIGAPTRFVYDGEEYEIPAASEWDLDALEAYEDGKIVATVRALLGPDGWAKFRAKPRKVADLEGIFLALQEALGLGN